MKRYSFVAVLLSTALVATAAYADGFHGHHGSPAMMSCIVVMPAQQKNNLKQLFASEKETLKADREAVKTAKKVLTEAILSGSKDVSAEEQVLSSAEQQYRRDRDALTIKVCGELSPQQRSAAKTLFTQLTDLHEQAHRDIRAARASAGAPSE